MQRLTPTAQELTDAAESQLAEIEQADRNAWKTSRMTSWLFARLESLRMDALEAAEEAVADDIRSQLLTGEARTIKNVMEDIVVSLEEENDEHQTSRTSSSRPTRKSAPKV